MCCVQTVSIKCQSTIMGRVKNNKASQNLTSFGH